MRLQAAHKAFNSEYPHQRKALSRLGQPAECDVQNNKVNGLLTYNNCVGSDFAKC